MEDKQKVKDTPRFGEENKTDFFSLLKQTIKNQKKNKNKNKSKNKEEQHSKINSKQDKIEKNTNSKEKSDLPKSLHINKDLAIERWFCDFPKKRLVLRNDFDHDHSKIFLQEKEKAFEKLYFNDDLLLDDDQSNSN